MKQLVNSLRKGFAGFRRSDFGMAEPALNSLDVKRRLNLGLFVIGLAVLFAFSSCQEESDPQWAEIQSLEQKMAKWPSSAFASDLIKLYGTYAEEHAEEPEKAAQALLGKARNQLYLKRSAAAETTLKTGLSKYFDTPAAYDMLVLLANVWRQKPEMETAAQAIYAALPEAFPDRPQAAALRDSLAVDLSSVPQQLDSLKLALYNSQVRIDRAVAERFVNMAEAYSLVMPHTKEAPAYLFDAAKVAGYLGNFSRAINLYSRVYEQYPEYEKAHQALFMLGFIYDSDLKDYDKAKRYYELYVEKYPEGVFADQIEMLIKNLGKSDEELLQELTKGK